MNTRCHRCEGMGVIDHFTHRLWIGIPGGCYGCDGDGQRTTQIANRLRHLRGKWPSAGPRYRARLVAEGQELQAEYIELTGIRCE